MRKTMDIDAFLEMKCTNPGDVVLFSGHMGKGKTHAAIALSQISVERSSMPTYLLTNVPFEQRNSERSRDSGYPDKVYGVRSLDQLFRSLNDIMAKHPDGDYRAIWLLDEAQNFMRAESHMTPLTNMMHAFMANIRKLNVAVWMITPLKENLGPRMRDGPVSGRDGYVTVIFDKDMSLIGEFLSLNRADVSEAFRFMAVSWRPDKNPYILRIPSTSWTQPLDKLAIGECAYDTKGIASFEIGEGFRLQDMMTVLSQGTSREMARALNRFYDVKASAAAADPETSKEVEFMTRVKRGREILEMTWSDIAKYEGLKKTTLQSRFYNFRDENPSFFSEKASEKTNEDNEGDPTRREIEKEGINEGGVRGGASRSPEEGET